MPRPSDPYNLKSSSEINRAMNDQSWPFLAYSFRPLSHVKQKAHEILPVFVIFYQALPFSQNRAHCQRMEVFEVCLLFLKQEASFKTPLWWLPPNLSIGRRAYDLEVDGFLYSHPNQNAKCRLGNLFDSNIQITNVAEAINLWSQVG